MNISLESCERSRPPQLSTAFFYAYMQLDKTWTLSLQSKTPATLVFLAATTCNKVGACQYARISHLLCAYHLGNSNSASSIVCLAAPK